MEVRSTGDAIDVRHDVRLGLRHAFRGTIDCFLAPVFEALTAVRARFRSGPLLLDQSVGRQLDSLALGMFAEHPLF